MKKRAEAKTDAGELRHRAELRAAAQPQDSVPGLDALKLLHELQVHQIELEMQNEALQQAKTETENLLDRYTELYDYAPVGYFTLDADGAIVQVNLAGAALLGVERARLTGKRLGRFVADRDRRPFSDFLHRAFAGARKESCEMALAGEASCIVRVDALTESLGQNCRVTMTDITERKQEEEKVRESEEKFRSIYEGSNDAIMLLTERAYFDCNARTLEIFGLTGKDEFINMHPSQLSPPSQPDGRDSLIAANEKIATALELGSNRFDWMHRRKNGEDFSAEVLLSAFCLGGKKVLQATVRDITDQKQAREIIWRHANYDDLTGLPNRHMFRDRLELGIKNAVRDKSSLALLFLDLDHFKEVNDTLGHDMGDILLIEAARRIVECVRETDTVARLGGDEFAIVLHSVSAVASIEHVAQNILDKLAAPFPLGKEIAFVSASIGIALYPEDADTVDGLLKYADQAMYVVKNSGRNRYSYFTPALQQAAEMRSRLINDLRAALAGNQFRVYYQPIVELATGDIRKAEALIRWQHPQRGLVSPAEFIPLAEQTGMIVKIGDWVFKESVRQVKRLRENYPDFQISVNKSPVQFHQDESKRQETWVVHLREQGLPGQSIVVEITEGLLLDAASHVTDKLLAFRDAGIGVSLDDFGTGYSALSYLKKFDIDYLKIDQSFVRNMENDAKDIALCEAIIVMAHKLGIKVIAEGVETKAQHDLLVAADCDYAQGYLFSKPVPMEQFGEVLNALAVIQPPVQN